MTTINHKKIFIKACIETSVICLPIFIVAWFCSESIMAIILSMLWAYGFIFARYVIPTSPIYYNEHRKKLWEEAIARRKSKCVDMD